MFFFFFLFALLIYRVAAGLKGCMCCSYRAIRGNWINLLHYRSVERNYFLALLDPWMGCWICCLLAVSKQGRTGSWEAGALFRSCSDTAVTEMSSLTERERFRERVWKEERFRRHQMAHVPQIPHSLLLVPSLGWHGLLCSAGCPQLRIHRSSPAYCCSFYNWHLAPCASLWASPGPAHHCTAGSPPGQEKNENLFFMCHHIEFNICLSYSAPRGVTIVHHISFVPKSTLGFCEYFYLHNHIF